MPREAPRQILSSEQANETRRSDVMQEHEAAKALLKLTGCAWVAEYTHGRSILRLQEAIVVHGELVQPLDATSRRVVILLGLVSPVIIGEIGGVASERSDSWNQQRSCSQLDQFLGNQTNIGVLW
ncbi:hypothetical protein GW17_00056566 [Ensete ventricosum]|nr:hypothetical protein GW17_00056566 [Ensete ventricosum]